ncbi:hypothetical protein C4D60_Mb06t17290 [Musa balbisiana]|uniref:Leucine-rich repeat-containing N-terminal plant-type domain-containing protein n=1 Tax=Musa balbisiana TaxID=52838 RepID=A0A4S8INP0_MUSBA|nr:hypothetical protein C4D60_Mb06t17290 [Musa balbisiana]
MDGVSPLKLPLQSPLPSPLLVFPHYPRMASLPVLLPCLLLLLAASPALSTNPEGEALHAWRTRLTDPTNVLQSWDPTLVNPCTWFHVTCDSQNRVIRLDLGNSNISGSIGPELGGLERLQYLELYRNNFQGKIPAELGNLRSLISMDLYRNHCRTWGNSNISGSIGPELGGLERLQYLFWLQSSLQAANNNRLSGSIPRELVLLSNLKVLDLSNNDLCGTIPIDGPFATSPFRVLTTTADSMDLNCKAWSRTISAVESYVSTGVGAYCRRALPDTQKDGYSTKVKLQNLGIPII